jgi:hypothetical protein
MNYKLYMISFKNEEHTNACSTLMVDHEDPRDWQIKLLEEYLGKLKRNSFL